VRIARFDRIRATLYGWTMILLLRLLWATWRVNTEEIRRFDALLRNRRFIVCFWHGKYIPLFILLRNHDACIFSSQSFRGMVISTICRHFGYRCVLIPERGEEAYQRMKSLLATGGTAGIAVDGPLGPRHEVKRGAVRLASELNVPLLGVSVAASRSRVEKGRWDRQEIPLPFSRVSVAVGDPIPVPSHLADDALGTWQDELARELGRLDLAAAEKVRSA
jgi:lysophospholipid acyltransferase (LPLAT)-like uncharacterized protein